jgi:hypothetical protein
MSDDTTITIADPSTEHHWSPAPALTRLTVIVVWYLGVAALLLSQAFST